MKNKKKIAISIVAHVDSGKTTLSESILYNTGKIKGMGRVDHGDSYLDNNEIERERGITVYSKETTFGYMGKDFTLIDTPGHADFHAELVKSLYITDMVILLISAPDGIDMHTVNIYKLLTKLNIPTLIFVNKMDITTRTKEDVMELLKRDLTKKCVDMSEANTDQFVEDVVEKDDELLERFFAGEDIDIEAEMKTLVNSMKVLPVFFGAALKNEGVEDLLLALGKWSDYRPVIDEESNESGGICYGISRDKDGEKLTHIRVTSGEFHVRMVYGEEKITSIRIYDAGSYKTTDKVEVGQVCALCGLKDTYLGCGLGSQEDVDVNKIKPVLSYSIIIDDDTPFRAANEYLKIMSEEDPTLNIKWNENTKVFTFTPMGSIQLDVLKRTLAERFSMNVHFDKGDIIYKETISNESYGVGHYEPLRHYSEVLLKITPLPEGSGIEYANECVNDTLAPNWQKLIMSHMKEREHLGVLIGAPLTDVRYTLVDARAHKKHTEGGDFRQAVYRGIRQGLMQGGCTLLEPVYEFGIKVPTTMVGRAMNDIKKMSGNVEETLAVGDMSVLRGRCPVSTIMEYALDIAAYTSGKGTIELNFAGYLPCHNTEEVVEERQYDPEADLDNSPDSVFCSHGSAVFVKWNEVRDHMHLVIPDKSGRTKANDAAGGGVMPTGKGAKKEKTDDEALMEIFERTYGPVKVRRENTEKKVVSVNEPDPKYKKKKKIVYKDEFLLVDGYNIIFAWEFLKELAEENLLSARDKLIQIMQNYQGYVGVNLILVFDAYKVKGGTTSVEKHHNITVVYTKEAETADMYIERVTKKIAKDNKVRVATSDAMEQCIILGHGATRVSARTFFEEVCRVEDSIRSHIEE